MSISFSQFVHCIGFSTIERQLEHVKSMFTGSGSTTRLVLSWYTGVVSAIIGILAITCSKYSLSMLKGALSAVF